MAMTCEYSTLPRICAGQREKRYRAQANKLVSERRKPGRKASHEVFMLGSAESYGPVVGVKRHLNK